MNVIAFKCKNCGHVNYPRHARCLNCRGREFEELAPEGEAKLLTFTEVSALPWGIDERCRTLGIAEFANGVKAMGWLKAERPRLGMRLKAGWGPVRVIEGEAVSGLIFEPA